ncbi:MAG: uracil-DNA glycosylase family protein [Alphaproteobacteria bacterium]|nr:uracil-DNA glycosylase family protein [Alphaproteobacteria bacterium]
MAHPRAKPDSLSRLLAEIGACRLCAEHLEPRPVLRVSRTARILIAGQAPGLRVHKSGIPFSDPSGDRLRHWMGVDADTFYDESRIAIIPMGFCFPGYSPSGADKPPRRECARAWRGPLLEALPDFALTLVVGSYAQAWHLGSRAKPSLGETVRAFAEYAPDIIPLPHPSWRNNAWLKKNPWFERDLLPYLRARVAALLCSAS